MASTPISIRNARISALWKPNDAFHAQLSYYYQTGDGRPAFPYVATSPAGYNIADQPGEPAVSALSTRPP